MKKLLALLLICATMLMLPISAFAESKETVRTEKSTWVNPMFGGVVFPERLPSEADVHATASATVYEYGDAAFFWAAEMKKHTSKITVTIVGRHDVTPYDLFYSATQPDGDPNGGDYIRWGIIYWEATYSDGSSGVTLTIEPRYITTAAQEKTVDTKVKELVSQLKLPKKNDYLTLKALYDWVCANITYDQTHLDQCSDPNDPNYYFLMHSAYAALVDRTCVCQGYALLLYRVGVEVGLNTRLVSSESQNHAWNIFKMLDNAYECDATWDAGSVPDEYNFFLRGKTSWLNLHYLEPGDATIGDEYSDYEYRTRFPLSDSDFSYTKHTLTLEPENGRNTHSIGDAVYYSFLPFYEYSIVPPEIDGYRLYYEGNVTGIMPATDTTVKVYYEPYFDFSLKAEVVDGGIRLDWNPIEEGANYWVYRKKGNGNWEYYTSVSNVSSYLDEAVEVSTKYSYRIQTISHDVYESEAVTAKTGSFLDVPPSLSCYKAVEWAAGNGIVSGTSDTTFSPGATCTRAQFALMLYRMAGKPEVDMSTNPFTDLPNNAGIQKAIVWAYNEGIVNGSGAGTFKPKDNITRAQLILMLYKMGGKPHVSGQTCPFTDLDGLTSNNVKAIIWAYNAGIVGGTSATTFSPKKNCTRGQLVIMLFRYNKIFGLV